MAATTITRSAFTNGTTAWNAATINSSVYDAIDQMFGGAGSYATFEFGGAVKVGGSITPTTSAAALGASTTQFAGLYLTPTAPINWGGGFNTITPSGSGFVLEFRGATSGYSFDGPLLPSINNDDALGSASLSWIGLFLGSGAAINFANGDVTQTHGTNTLTWAGASSVNNFNDGNVGIGITPASVLHVERAGADNIIAAIGQTGYEGILYLSGAGSGKESVIIAGNNRNLLFKTTATATPTATATTRMVLNSGGELWIGYTTDQGAYLLQVNSQIFATNATIATSDARFKTHVQPVQDGLSAVRALKPVAFRWKPHPVHNFIKGTDVGFLAQDVQQALAGRAYAETVVTTNGTGAHEFLGMADSKLIPLLVAAVQELAAKVDALTAH